MSSLLPFGGPLGAFVDPVTGRSFPARVVGTAVFEREVAREMLASTRKLLVDVTAGELGRSLKPDVNLLSFVRSPELEAAVGRAASAALGQPVRIEAGMTIAFTGADDAEVARAVQGSLAAAPSPATASICPACGAPAPGKFCAGCGAAQAASPPPAPSKLEPSFATPFLAFPVGHPIAAGTRVDVPANHCFVGFAGGAIALNLQAGSHVLASPFDAGVFISLRGLPFSMKVYVSGRGRMELHGALYMQDPVVAFRNMQTIDATFVGVLQTVLGRIADRVAPSAADERALCSGIMQAFPQEPDGIRGVTLHLDAARPLPE